MRIARAQISLCNGAQSDQGLRYPLTESLDTTECSNGGKMPGLILRMRGMNLNFYIMHTLEDTVFACRGPHQIRFIERSYSFDVYSI